MFDRSIYDLSSPGRMGAAVPELTVPEDESLADLSDLLRTDLDLPEVSENEVVRHVIALSRKNYHIDQGMYPLGSCTMKYNPKVNEDMAALPGFARLHPLTPVEEAQGALELIDTLGRILLDLTGMEAASFQPAAGAQGELTSLMMVQAHFRKLGQPRTEVLTPDSSHGTNPASAAMCRFQVREVKSDPRGEIDRAHLASLLSEKTACVMITNPNTLGIFEENIEEVAAMVHGAGALMYMDGANMNALLGRARPGDMGFDVMHLNLHKTFSTPHGGGGPGSGPIFVKKLLEPYLPIPRVERTEGGFVWSEAYPDTIGRVHGAFGNYGMLVRALTYVLSLGLLGLKKISKAAVLNASYLKEKLKGEFLLPYDKATMHEFVFSGAGLKKQGVRTLDVAKRLLDYGFHAPTIYFPLIVEEALMIEPTESESLDTLDRFVDALTAIAREARETPQVVLDAPHTTLVKRLDETRAARQPVLSVRSCCP